MTELGMGRAERENVVRKKFGGKRLVLRWVSKELFSGEQSVVELA